MIQLSHRNHFRFGYNGQAFNFRQSPEDQWWVGYGPCEFEPGHFWQECIETAKRIRENTREPIWVLLSGGVDSEMVLRAFKAAEVEVTAAILRFVGDLNIHDTSYAVIACEQMGVPYKFFDLDLFKFWETQLWEYAEPTQCPSPQLITTMYLVDQIDGFPVLGSGECLLAKKTVINPAADSTPWVLREREKIASWYRHFMRRGREGAPGFFQYTPEIMLAYLRDPLVRKLTKNELAGEESSERIKPRVYQSYVPLLARPKYTGFERVRAEDNLYRSQLQERFSHCNQTVETEVSALEEMLRPENEIPRPSAIQIHL